MQKSNRHVEQIMKHINVTVSGCVQGVYFRASTKEVADSLGINGFVKNQSDGSVYLEAEANEDTLELFLTWLKIGPATARVDNLKIEDSDCKYFGGFIISH